MTIPPAHTPGLPGFPEPPDISLFRDYSRGVALEQLTTDGWMIRQVNPAFVRSTGLSEESCVGTSVIAALASESIREPWRKAALQAKVGDPCEGTILPGRHADHTFGYYRVELLHPNHACRIWLLTDVSANQAKLTALQDTATRYKLLVDHMHEMVTVYDLNGRCHFASPSCKRLLGFTPFALMQRPVETLLDPRDNLDLPSLLPKLRRKPLPNPIIHRVKNESGEWVWMQTHWHLQKSRISPTLHEIVATSQPYGMPSASLPQIPSIPIGAVTAHPFAMAIIGADECLIYGNLAFADLNGQKVSEMKGRPAAAILPVTLWQQACQHQGQILHGRCQNQDRFIPVEFALVEFGETHSLRKLIILREVLNSEESETRMLRDTQERLDTLAGGIAHDFNNILAIILGYASLLPGFDGGPELLEEYATYICSAAQRGASVVRKLQLYANLHVHQSESVNLHNLVLKTIRSAEQDVPNWPRCHLALDARKTTLQADPIQIDLALRNILENACEATKPPEGEITIASLNTPDTKFPRYSEPGILLTITDNGRGMDAYSQSRVFDPFYTTNKSPNIHGLGMSVTHGVMKAHRGNICVKSQPGAGTTVELYFPQSPITSDTTPKISTTCHVAATDKAARPCILIVEDEPYIIQLWPKMVERLGWDYRVAVNGREALKIFEQEKDILTVVFTDIGLPDMDGWEMAEIMRQQKPSLPILLTSGSFNSSALVKAESLSPVQLFPKPVLPETLIDQLHRLHGTYSDSEE